MMAEALTLNGETEEALGYFRRVFESPLMNDPIWKVRLSLDLAHTSLKQGEPGTAVAILQEAILADPNDRAVLQTLTRAYSDAGLTSGALETARLVLNLAPADIDNLIWFAEQALSLQSPLEALDALQRAVELRPQERGLYTLLAKSQMRAGQRQEALATFERISSAPNTGLADLLEAASGLLEFNEPGRAIACLERARSELSGLAAGVSPSNAEMLALMTALAKAYQRVGNPQAALDAVEQAMVVMPEASADMYKLKADIYLMLNRDQAALACLEQAIALHPQDSQAHLDAMAFLHREGNLTAALEHARNLTESPAFYRLPAAEFARMMLDNGLVRLLIGNPHQEAEKNPLQALALLCLAGELDLEDGNPDAAENKIEAMRVIVSENKLEIPAALQMRQAALEARLAMNQKDMKAARQWIQMADEAASKQESLSLSHKMALAEAALELGDWHKAIPLLTQAADSEPAAPLPSLNLARALTLQAETQRLYQAIHVRSHAPGDAALSKENFHIFDAAIRKAAQAVLSGKSGTPQRLEWKSVPQSIQRWWVRGKAAFDANPSQDTLLALSRLPANPEDTSAAVAALGRAGNLSLAAQMGRDYPYDPQVQSQLALALLEKSPNEALEVAIKAVESQLVNGATPQLYALVALAAQRVDDSETSIEAIQKALEDWQDEAGWHDWAAQRFLEQNNALSAAMHLGKAANLEPHHIEHFMGLGKIFMEQNQPSQAVRSLEEAVVLDAKRQDAWLLLAKAQMACADFIQAATSADTAIHLKPDDLDAVLIRSEIALKAGEPMVAYKQAKSALHMNQKNAQVFRILSKSLAALKQPDKAMRALEKAAELAHEQDVQGVLPLQMERIQLIRQTQGEQAALPQLVSLVEKNPEDAQLLAYYAEVLSAVEQFEPALQAAQMALQYAEAGNQDNQGNHGALTDAQQAELHAMAGRLLRRKGQLDQALHHFVEAMHLNPQQIEIYLDLGMTYQERRQHSEALQIYRNAMQIAPEDARPYYNTALALKESKDYTGAERMLQKAARLAPDDVRIQRLLGSIVAVNLVHGS
jgi:tetratricopeptide (TPR) repeat protein